MTLNKKKMKLNLMIFKDYIKNLNGYIYIVMNLKYIIKEII